MLAIVVFNLVFYGLILRFAVSVRMATCTQIACKGTTFFANMQVLGWECVENLHFACNPPGYQLSMEEIIKGNLGLDDTAMRVRL